MDRADLAARVDHTVLGPATTAADARRVAAEAAEWGANACVPPCYLREAADAAPDVPLVTVVGFPHGQHVTAVKRAEASRAEADGAAEVDVVANVGRLLGGEDGAVRDDLAAVVDAVSRPVKVIVEAPLLDEPDLRRACRIAADAGADMVKTATGFGEGGATAEDVAVMAEYLPVKASGGVGSWAAARRMLDAGAERIGTSSGVTVLEEFVAASEG